MEAHVYPNEEEMFAQVDDGDRWQPIPLLEELKAKARAEGLWNLFLPESDVRRRALQPRLCARLRGDGALPLRARGLQLLGARYRQHGGAGPLRHRGAARGMAHAAARRRDSLRLRHDRGRGRILRRRQHRDPDRARRRGLRHQRAQVVDLGRFGPPLPHPDRHGQDRPGEFRSPQAAVDDPGAAALARRHGEARAAGLRLRRCAARPRRGAVRERARAGGEHAAGRGPGLRDRAGALGAGPHPPLHAPDRPWRSARSSACAGARWRASPSASRSRTGP